MANLYVSPSGSDAGACGQTSPCLTIAYTLSTIPALLTQPYQINLANGTYAEAIDGRGYSGTLSMVGNLSSPSSVVITGSLSGCEAPRYQFTTAVCLQGKGSRWMISGLTVSSTVRNGVTCDDCSVILNNVNVSGSTVCGVLNEAGYMTLQGNVTISGFAQGDVTNSTFGLYNAYGRIVQNGGTLTINGPGWANGLLSYGIAQEFQSNYTLLTSCDTCSTQISIVVNNVRYGIQGTSNSSLASFVSHGTITMNNPTQSPGNGIDLYNEATFDLVGGSSGINLNINNFSTCISSQQYSTMSHGPGNRSLTGCNPASGTNVVLF